ncbi:hypothetical protein GQ600_22409 [Phytophthora cactorum]|nr:hypothetical protein GQ600_22409 [Phytophthora cactorum]
MHIDMKKQETASLKNLPVHASRRAKPRFTESLLFIALALLVVGLLTCGFIIEAYILSQTPVTFLFGGNLSSCSPGVVDLRSVKYHSDHEYYNKLRALTPLKPPVFHGEHAPLVVGVVAELANVAAQKVFRRTGQDVHLHSEVASYDAGQQQRHNQKHHAASRKRLQWLYAHGWIIEIGFARRHVVRERSSVFLQKEK